MSSPVVSTDVRPLGPDDLDWLLAVTLDRRAALVPHAPRWWHPAPDAAARQRAFLAHLLEAPTVLSVRTDHAYLIAFERRGSWIVDDLAVTPDGTWADDGSALLDHARGHCERLRVVVPVAEPHLRDAVHALGLHPVEHWWHRDLPTLLAASAGPDRGTTLTVAGATGRLAPAPPVYAPGGPVLAVDEPGSPQSLTALESAGSARGATVAVAVQSEGDTGRADVLEAAGYTLTTSFYATV